MEEIKRVKSGSVEIIIRKYSDGRFGFDSHNKGRRKQHRWREQADAIDGARDHARAVAAGNVDLLSIDKKEWAVFCAWQREGFTMEDLVVFREWKAARSKSRLVRDVETEMMAIKDADTDLDSSWITNVRNTLKLFSETFGRRQIVDIEAEEIEKWLLGLGKQPRNRNNIRAIVVSLFRFARDRKWLPWGEKTAAEQTTKLTIRTRADNIEIYTPAELEALITSVHDDFKPWALLGAFAGIRTEEIRPKAASAKDPLRWEDFQWVDKQIFVRAETAKTGRQRYVPISDNLAAWLKPYRKRKGPVVTRPASALYEETRALPLRGVVYRKNGLRHSYGSYRNAIIRNINQLAEEMGNSPAIARRNYEKPQPRSIADKWFSVVPG